MKCEEALALLSGHIDGQNTQAEEQALQAHLADCASCRALLEAYEQIDSGVAGLEENPPAELAPAVMNRVRAEQELAAKPRKKRRFVFGPGTAIAAVAAVLLLLLSTGKIPSLHLGSASSGAMTKSTLKTADEAVTAEDEGMGVTTAAPQAAARAENFSAEDSTLETAYNGNSNAGADKAQPEISAEQPELGIQSVPLYDQPETIHLVIYDDKNSSALQDIQELSSMEQLEPDDSGPNWYVTDVQMAKTLVKTYGSDYDMDLDDAAQSADAAAVCVIRVIEP